MVKPTEKQRGIGEFSFSDESQVGFFSGPGFVNMRVEYKVINGYAIAEGDILLGKSEELKKSGQPKALEEAVVKAGVATPGGIAHAGIVFEQYLWLDCVIPYDIDGNLPNQSRVIDAINHWTQNTGIRFVRRTNQADYIYFTDLGGCWSYIGRRGGRQEISLGPNCSTGNTIHEIGHALGMFHEQSRNDRDIYVRINWQNIIAGNEGNFYQYLNNGRDVGEYDYCSIMHYPRTAFSNNNQDTITPLRPGADCMGQRNGLSPKDIAAIKQVYSKCLKMSCEDYLTKAKGYYNQYKITKATKYLCYYYLYVARYFKCKYNETKQKKYLCYYYYYVSKYFLCLYKRDKKMTHLDSSKKYMKAYRICGR